MSLRNWGGVAANFHDVQLENQTSDRLRIGGILLVTNSSIDCESFISGLSSPLRPAGTDPRVGDVWNPLPVAFKYTFQDRMQRS